MVVVMVARRRVAFSLTLNVTAPPWAVESAAIAALYAATHSAGLLSTAPGWAAQGSGGDPPPSPPPGWPITRIGRRSTAIDRMMAAFEMTCCAPGQKSNAKRRRSAADYTCSCRQRNHKHNVNGSFVW
eukprot:7286226-Prymnesium_polylepis.2